MTRTRGSESRPDKFRWEQYETADNVSGSAKGSNRS